MLPYWSLYLQAQGFAPARIGELMAIPLATKVVAPNVWGWIADRSGRRMAIVRFACLAAALCFAGVFAAAGAYLGLALVMLSFSFFWNAALPQFEAVTLNHLGAGADRYSAIRLWGSIGFIVTALVLGGLVERLGTAIVPPVLLALLVAIWLISLIVPERPAHGRAEDSAPLFRVLQQPRVASLLLICFLVQASHGPYYAFFSIYLEGLDYRRSLIGLLWGLGVVAEVVIFLLMHRLLPRFGARRLMLVSLVLTGLRWLLIAGLAHSLPVLLFAQSLHAFSFGMYHAVAIHLIHRFFVGRHQGRGQALYSSLSFGAGGALGSLAAGYLWVGLGAGPTYALAAVLSALAWLIAWRGLYA